MDFQAFWLEACHFFFNLTRCCFFLKPCPGIQFHHVQWAHLQVTWCWLWCLQEWSSGRWLCIGWSITTLGWRHCTLAVVTAGDDEIEIRDMRSNCWQNGKTYGKWLMFGDFEMVWQLMLTQSESSWHFKSVPTRQFHHCTARTKDQIVVASPAPSGRICAEPSCLLGQYIE